MASVSAGRKRKLEESVSDDEDEEFNDQQFEGSDGDAVEDEEVGVSDEDEPASDDWDEEFGMYLGDEDQAGILGEDADGDADHSSDGGHQQGSGSDGDGEGDDGKASRKPDRPPAKFTEGEKGLSFANAFAKAMKAGEKKAKKVARPADIVLADSSTLLKRKAEEAASVAERKAAKKLKLEMKTRGHRKVPRKGEDPEHDQQEKALMKLATRGVVLLFNAVAKAQKQSKEAALPGAKPQRLNKGSFLAMLRGNQAGASTSGAPGRQQQHEQDQQQQPSSSQPPSGTGWDVLKDGFTGLATKGSKMKDWDRQGEEEEEDSGPPDMGDSGSDDDDEGGW